MKIYTKKELREHLVQLIDHEEFDHDNYWQLVIYTGVFEWEDGSYRDEPEPEALED